MGKWMIRAFAAICVALIVVPISSAAAPTRAPFPTTDDVISGTCPFDVAVHVTAQKNYSLAFSNGTLAITGMLKVDLTNERSGTMLSLNIPGPGYVVDEADGTLKITLL